MRNLDATIRVRMVLCQTSMLLFVSVHGVMPKLDAIIRVLNYVRLNPSVQRARPLWSGASDKFNYAYSSR